MRKIAAVSFLLGSIAFGASWEDVLKSVDIKKYKLYDDGNFHTGEVYKAKVIYRVINGNNDGKLQANEKVYIKVIGPANITVETPYPLTKDGLVEWAKQHSTTLLKAVFGPEPSETFVGTSTSLNNTITVAEAISSSIEIGTERTLTPHEIQKVTIEKTPQQTPSRKEKVSNVKKTLSKILFPNVILLQSEKADLTVDGYDGSSTAGYLKYSRLIKQRFIIGSVLAYRYTKIDDEWNSKARYITLYPFIGFSHRVTPKLNMRYTAHINVGVLYAKSKMFPDGAGYLDYGFGFAISPVYSIFDKLYATVSFGYQYNKKYVPENLVPDDLKFLAEAINGMKPSHIGSINLKFTFIPIEDLYLVAGVYHAKQLSGELERDKATYYYGYGKYNIKRFSLMLGYKISDGIKNYDEKAYMASVGFNW